jgi:hypothetical protein
MTHERMTHERMTCGRITHESMTHGKMTHGNLFGADDSFSAGIVYGKRNNLFNSFLTALREPYQ